MKYFLIVTSLFLILGCQADPAEKQVPKDDKKIVNKKLNNVSFNPAVDILFVVDDSGSMGGFQDSMSENARFFIEEIFRSKFIDYHIGVVTSTYGDWGVAGQGKLVTIDGVNFVNRKTPSGRELLEEMLRVGTSGSGSEEFFSIVDLAFSQEHLTGANKGFYREDAFLAIFIVTDSDDQSDFSVIKHEELLLDLKKKDRTKIHYTGAIIDQKVTSDCTRSGEPFPRKIKDAIDLFKGTIFELCDADYGKNMAKVAQKIVRGVSTIYLDELPDLKTLKVTYGGKPLPQGRQGWTYDPDINAIRISPDTKITENKQDKLNVKFESIYK